MMSLKFFALPHDQLTWKVDAYGKISASTSTPDAPVVDVQISSQQLVSERIIQVGLYDLLDMPIGSFWRGQKRVRHSQGKRWTTVKTFELDILGWDGSSFIKAYSRDLRAEKIVQERVLMSASALNLDQLESNAKRYLIPPNVLKVNKKLANTRYFHELADCGTELIIPCLTMFLRTYGISKNFKEFFLNYELESALKKMIYHIDLSKLQNQPAPGDYALGLMKEMNDGDAPFIQQLLESWYFKRVHRFIRHQLNAHLRHGLFLSVPMWFRGHMQLRVKGVPYLTDEGKERFLVQDILGISYPRMPRLFLDRNNTNIANDEGAAGSDEEKPLGWGGSYGRPRNGEETQRDSRIPPGQNAGTVTFQAPTVQILGSQPEVTKAIRKSKVTGGKKDNEAVGVEYDSTSTSGAFSSNSRIAKAREHHEPNKHEAEEKLSFTPARHIKDVIGLLYKALESLKGSSFFESFEFIGKESGKYFVEHSFQVINFSNDFDDSWQYHGKHKENRRLLAVAKLTFCGGNKVFVCEIQPRINRNGNSDGNLKGCVLLGPQGGLNPAALDCIIKSLIEHKGVWSKVPEEFTGPRYAYRHVGEPTEDMMSRSIKAAIEKLPGMKVEKKKRKRKAQDSNVVKHGAEDVAQA